MKARLSFVSRRPSQKPEPTSPRGAAGGAAAGAEDDGPPMPEPLASPEMIPRASVLGQSTGAPGNSAGKGEVPLAGDGPTSPNFAKSRSKSILDLKKKASSLSEITGGGSGPGAGVEADTADTEPKQVFPSSVREGFLKKKGVVNLAWKKRYIVLLRHQLAYYDEQPTSADALPKGFINLASILRCEHHDAVSSLKDCTFDVVTPTRIFRLQAESLAAMDAWIASISGTAANEQQIIASRKRNVSHAALRTLAEQDRLKIDDSARISHEVAELRQWPTWNTFEVAAWIQTFGMGRYSTDFYNKGITGEKLKTIDDAALVALGIDEKVDRTKILTNIKKLQQDTKRG
jgi:hypothetical protein